METQEKDIYQALKEFVERIDAETKRIVAERQAKAQAQAEGQAQTESRKAK